MTQKLEFVPPNSDFLVIARLYLEKYEILNDEDRKLYRGMLLQMANPPMIVQKESDPWAPQRISEAIEIEHHNAKCAEFLARDREEKEA